MCDGIRAASQTDRLTAERGQTVALSERAKALSDI